MTIYFKNLKNLSSISTFTDTMVQTNLAYANTISKLMIIKNLDYLFKNVFTESKASQKHSSKFSKFWLRFYNNTRCNQINQMVALRKDWYSLISIHKSASKAMLYCLMTLNEQNIWNHILTRVWLQFQNFKCSLLLL